MHPRIREIVDYLAEQRAGLSAAFDSVQPDLRGRRPVADRWSVAEIVEHLAIVETRITRMVSGGVRSADPGPEKESTPVLPTLNLASVLDPSERRNAPEVLEPTGGLTEAEAWTALGRSREELLAALAGMDGLAIGIFRSPHRSLGELDGYQWLIFIGAHEGRHARQIREVGLALTPELDA